MNIEELYLAILEFAGCSVNEAGYVQLTTGKEKVNVIIDGKDLVFPTAAQMRNPQPNTIVFHPLSENEMGGEPPVITRLRDMIFLRFNKVISDVCLDLISVINSTELHKNLVGPAQDILYKGISVNAGSGAALAAIMRSEQANFGKMFVAGWLRKGGQVRNQTYSRAGIVNFPLFTKLQSSDFKSKDIKGVRKDDPLAFCELLRFIFPKIDDPKEYYEGSDSRIAPYFDALMRMSKRIAADIQIVLDNFDGVLVNSTEHNFNGDWISSFDNLESYRGQIALIPTLSQPTAINAGVPEKPAGTVDLASVIAAATAQNNQVVMPPQQPAKTGGRRSITELAATNPIFGANLVMENSKGLANNTNMALAAILSGNGNADALNLVSNALAQQNQVKDRIVKQVGEQRYSQVVARMQAGMSERDAVMWVLANIPAPQDPAKLLAQALLASGQGGNNNTAALLAALAGGNNNTASVPTGYPQGEIIEVAGRKFLKYTSALEGTQLLPL